MNYPPVIIWSMLFIAQFINAGVLEFTIKPVESAPGGAPVNPLVLGLILTSVVAMVLSWFIPKTLWKTAAQKLPTTDSTSEPVLLEAFMTGYIVRLALLESVCFYGFALAFLQKQPRLFLPFLGASVLGFIMNFPSRDLVRKSLGRDLNSH